MFLRSVLQMLVTANIVRSFLILSALKMEEIRSSKTLVLTRSMCHNIPEDGILLIRRENLKSYIALTDWAL
jgi:hypothetical protein